MTGVRDWLATFSDRCSEGYHLTAQHPHLCECQGDDEWSVFRAALRSAAKDGRVHQADVRPLIRGRIEPKHIGLAYRRAVREGLLTEVSRERSNDEAGRNTNKWEPVYEVAA